MAGSIHPHLARREELWPPRLNSSDRSAARMKALKQCALPFIVLNLPHGLQRAPAISFHHASHHPRQGRTVAGAE